MSLHYWFMFPVAIGVSTLAMASGIGGATFYAPIFLLALGLPVEVAIGTGLITEVFGFASGVTAYVRKRLIDYQLAGALLVVTVPLAILGSLLAGLVNPDVLKIILGMGLLGVAMAFLRAPEREDVASMDEAIEENYGGDKAETCLVSAAGEEIRYTVCNRTEGRLIAAVGALFLGLISTGLGEINNYFLLQRCRVPSKVAVATGVLVIAITALTAASTHLVRFLGVGGEVLGTVVSIAVFTAPGAVIGGQFGAAVAGRVPERVLERGLGILFLLIAALTIGEVVT